MNVNEQFVPFHQSFADTYVTEYHKLRDFFDYDYQNEQTFLLRKHELMSRHFEREKLADVLKEYHAPFQTSEQTIENIEKLRDPKTVVVIGGQQAGLLTGPLLVIYKLISIIQLAKQQETSLGVPVVPVFWIAGEDHDFEEVNHVFAMNEHHIQKLEFERRLGNRKAVSTLVFQKKAMKEWTQTIVRLYGEREYTKELLTLIDQWIAESSTYSDFFARIILHFFGRYGVVLVDSNDPNIRNLEVPLFTQIVDKNEELSLCVEEQFLLMKELRYPLPFEYKKNQANLFTFSYGDRILLERSLTGEFVGKKRAVKWTKEELKKEIENHPTQFSNNVVTRPIMQDFLFPVLAFVGGPGEILYWGTLKRAFHLFDFNIPPVIPRLSFSLVERHIKKYMETCQVTFEQVIGGMVEVSKENYLQMNEPADTEEMMQEIKQQIKELMIPLEKVGAKVDETLKSVAIATISRMHKELDTYHAKIKQATASKHDHILKKYDAIDHSLLPNGTMQERHWNIFYYLNAYGLDFIDRLMERPYLFNGKHKIIYI